MPWRTIPRSRHDARIQLHVTARVLDRHRIPEFFTGAIAAGLLLLGADLMRDPNSYTGTATFAVAVEWARPEAWGVLLILPCIATLIALAARRRDIYWPLLGLTGWLTGWGSAIAVGAGDEDSVASALIVYWLLSALTAALAAVYAREGREQP